MWNLANYMKSPNAIQIVTKKNYKQVINSSSARYVELAFELQSESGEDIQIVIVYDKKVNLACDWNYHPRPRNADNVIGIEDILNLFEWEEINPE